MGDYFQKSHAITSRIQDIMQEIAHRQQPIPTLYPSGNMPNYQFHQKQKSCTKYATL